MPDADSLVTRDDQGGSQVRRTCSKRARNIQLLLVGRWLASVKQSGGDM